MPAQPVVFPALAGINRSTRRRQTSISGVPRASGDKPQNLADEELSICVFPALAGINRAI